VLSLYELIAANHPGPASEILSEAKDYTFFAQG